ncbi:MAG: hypothetical protein FWG34_12755 [Oscillospiraceae bacterium]|nr:hypothetical protein [Oscillospiraceae bacterium]
MRVNYSCVVDNKERYQKQGWFWLNSLLHFGKIDSGSIYVHCVRGTDSRYIEKCAGTGANVSVIEPFGDKKFCNKIAQLSNEKLKDCDAAILMDTDMIMLENFEHKLDYGRVGGKIVYMKNPETEVIGRIFEAAGLKKSLPDIPIESNGGYLTYGANFNGGLYAIPGKYCEAIKSGWEKWSLWLLENGKALYEANKADNIDQVSFCMAVHEKNIPIKYFGRLYNYHVIFDLGEKEKIPYVLHYHTATDENGLISPDYVLEGKIKEAVEAANALIKKYI